MTTSTAPPSSSPPPSPTRCELAGKKIDDVKLVTSGAGAAALACLNLLVALGARRENIMRLATSRASSTQGRDDADGPLEGGLCAGHRRRARWPTCIDGADVFLGLSAAGVLKPECWPQHGAEAADHGARQSRPGDHAGAGARRRGPTRSICTGPLGLSRTRSTTSSASPTSSAARSTSAPTDDQRGMKIAAAHAIAELARGACPRRWRRPMAASNTSSSPLPRLTKYVLLYQDLLRPELLDAVADYTARHTPKSVHNMLATWRRFARHLVASGLLASNPFDTGADHKPRRWIPEALRYAELERTRRPPPAPTLGRGTPGPNGTWPCSLSSPVLASTVAPRSRSSARSKTPSAPQACAFSADTTNRRSFPSYPE